MVTSPVFNQQLTTARSRQGTIKNPKDSIGGQREVEQGAQRPRSIKSVLNKEHQECQTRNLERNDLLPRTRKRQN